MLVTVAKFLPVDISHIESLHAAIRRQLYIRSSHTHSMSFKDLSAQWVCMQFRRGAKRSGQRPGAPKRLTRKKRIKEKKQQKKGVIAKQKARKRPGKGGAWRAWIRGQGKALTRENMFTIQASYHAAKRDNTPEYQQAAAVGKAATRAAAHTGRGFGVKRSAVIRQAKSSMECFKALLARVPDEDVAEQALALARHSQATGATIAETLSVARAGKRERAARLRKAKEKDTEDLARYREDIGRNLVAAVRERCPALSHIPMQSEPSAHGLLLHVPAADADQVMRAWDWAAEETQKSGLATRLDAGWNVSHRAVANVQVQTEPAPTASDCLAAGMCLCDPDGLELALRARRFANYIKLVCPVRTERREKLLNGKLVVT